MSISERKTVGTPAAGIAANSRPVAPSSAEAGEDWRGLISGLSEAVDDLYSQNLFRNAEERLQATEKFLTQRLSQFRDVVVREVINSLQMRMDLPRQAESKVEVTVLETQLQDAQAQNRRFEENLEAAKRELNQLQAENRRLATQNEELQAELAATQERLVPDANATMILDADQTRLWSTPGAKPGRRLAPKTAPIEGSIFTSVVRLARACAGEEVVFDSEEQIGGVFDRVGQTLETLLQSTLKLIHGRWQFRTEFIGATIMHSSKSFTLQTARSAGEVKKFIFAPNLSDQEFAARQQLLKETMDELMLHQLALLEGYRTCVNEGTRKLLQVLDPAILTQKLNERKLKVGPWSLPVRAVPLLFQWHLLNYYRQKHGELLAEDRRVFEKKMYRPGFIRGYETRMATTPPAEPSGAASSLED